jgi:nucleotide-binding universal stress UspA family protein
MPKLLKIGWCKKMFDKVLIPVDFSKHARKVIEFASDIPGVKEVVLMNVVIRDPLARVWDPVSEVKNAEKKLLEEKNHLNVPGVTIKVRAIGALEGEANNAIQRVAEDEKISLIAMGARGKSLIRSILLGSIARDVLRFVDANLLIMRFKTLENIDNLEKYGTQIFSKVLFPTDFSQPAEAALSLLKNMDGIKEIILLHVVSKGETQEEIDRNIREAENKFKEIAQDLSKASKKVTSRVVVGDPVEEIRNMAKLEDASLIAMSAQGAVAIKKDRKIGSTAYDVANTAARPVLILKRSKTSQHYV